MKKSIYTLAIALCLSGIVFTACKSNTEKEADATEKVIDANENLDSVNEDITNDEAIKANDMEWQTYKEEVNTSIAANEVRIAELKAALKKPGNSFDSNYSKNIQSLEDRNASLKVKIKNYENNKTDWDSFKREVDSDMTELGKSFKDLTVNNKK
ncbi:hypothetical protein [Flavobacterium sp. TSSA_36]|uniref:hypothetical protein n=1 Tax=Flavobacterium sp. TSSA_36 TaxID=3447669 RepID=UPI003F308070